MKPFGLFTVSILLSISMSATAQDGGGGDCGGSSSSCDSGATAAGLTAVLGSSTSSSSSDGRGRSHRAELELVYAAKGVGLRTSRPLGTGERSVDFETLGRALATILHGESAASFTADDQSILLDTVVRNWPALGWSEDPNVITLLHALRPVHQSLELDDLMVNTSMRHSFRNLFVAFRMVEAHRRLSSPYQNLPLRQMFALYAYGVVRDLMYHRDIMKDYPTDAQILRTFRRFREEGGEDSRATFQPLVERLDRDLLDSLEGELKRQQVRPELRMIGFSAGAGAVVYWGAMLAGGVDWANAHGVGVWAAQGLLGAPLLTGGLGAGWWHLTKRARLERARARVEDFVRQCHASLVQ